MTFNGIWYNLELILIRYDILSLFDKLPVSVNEDTNQIFIYLT